VAAGLELAADRGPDAVVLREATRMVGVVPNAAYRHFADRDELLAAVSTAAMRELAARMAAGAGPRARQVRRSRRWRTTPAARASAVRYLEFAREEPGLFATAFALPQQHAYGAPRGERGSRREPGRTACRWISSARSLDELADAGVLDRRRRDGHPSTPSGPRCTGWP
jgi:AcrR family transcriptional regulator